MSATSSRSSNRRQFFARLGGGAAALTALGTSDSPFGAGTAEAAGGLDLFNDRANQAYKIRHQAALYQRSLPNVRPMPNGDELRLRALIGNYSKMLPHNQFGEVDRQAYGALVRATLTGDPEDYDAIPMGGIGKQVNPQSAICFEMIGTDPAKIDVRTPPPFASAEIAGEMVEVYWQALTLDVPFGDYASDPLVAAAVADLNGLTDFRGPRNGGRVTPATLFRGPTAGDLVGPYISQFLWKPVPMGPYTLEQHVRIAAPGVDYMTDWTSWLNVQNGGSAVPKQYVNSRRHIITGRDLTEWLHRDFSFQGFLNAALILLAGGPSLIAPGNPYRNSGNQVGFATFGGPAILDIVSYVAAMALRACWYQKWQVHRRVRPEAYAGAIEAKYVFGRSYPLHTDVLRSQALAQVLAKYGTRLLPCAFPEGSPAHPSYPSGHAAIAGACTTMLKAFFNGAAPMPNPVMPDATGSTLVPYSGPALTVGGELDKLASNVAIGRDTAGVHWRTDGEQGLYLGEQVAIGVLTDLRATFNEPFAGFSFRGFDGRQITI